MYIYIYKQMCTRTDVQEGREIYVYGSKKRHAGEDRILYAQSATIGSLSSGTNETKQWKQL